MAWKDVTVEGLQKWAGMVGIPPGDYEGEPLPHEERLALAQAKLNEMQHEYPMLYSHFCEGLEGVKDAILNEFGPMGAPFACHIEVCMAGWAWALYGALRDANEIIPDGPIVGEAEAVAAQAVQARETPG